MMCAVAEVHLSCVVAACLACREAVDIVDRRLLVLPREAASSLADWNGRHSIVVDDFGHFDHDVLCRSPKNCVFQVALSVGERNVVRMMNKDLNVLGDHHLQLSRTIFTVAKQLLAELWYRQSRVY